MNDTTQNPRRPERLVLLESRFARDDLPTPRSGQGATIVASRRSATLWHSKEADEEIARNRARRVAAVMTKKAPQRWTETLGDAGSGPKYVQWTATPLLDEEEVCHGCLVDAADITELEEARSDLEQRCQKLEMFSHSAAHTLKTDWKGISLLVSELEALLEEWREGGEWPASDIEALLGELGPRAARGAQTVHDLLVYATASAKPELKPSPLRPLVQSVAARVGGDTIEIADDVTNDVVPIDPNTFPVALLQLVENAVKYGEGKPVVISYAGGKLRVQDHGRGIPHESLAEIFGIFKRIATDVGGTGLGLAIAKQILDAHGFRVWAESDGPGKGSAFVIDIEKRS